MPASDDLNLDPGQLAKINEYLKAQLQATGKAKVGAVAAAGWLAEAGLLEQGSRPGVNLRKLLRAGQMRGTRQEPPPPEKNGSWFIGRATEGERPPER